MDKRLAAPDPDRFLTSLRRNFLDRIQADGGRYSGLPPVRDPDPPSNLEELNFALIIRFLRIIFLTYSHFHSHNSSQH